MADVETKTRRAYRGFKRRMATRARVLEDQLGPEEAAAVSEEAARRYRDLAPEVATIPKGMMNGALMGTYEYLAYAKALEARGHDYESVRSFFDDSYAALVDRVPGWLGRVLYRVTLPLVRWQFRREAKASLETDEGWRFRFVEGGETGHDFGFDVESCAVCAAFERHDA